MLTTILLGLGLLQALPGIPPEPASVRRIVRYINQTPGIRYRPLAIAIFRHETGNGTSILFRRHRNAFGFVFVAGKADYRAGRYGGYLTYQHSITHFQQWQTNLLQKNSIKSRKQYELWLKKHYSRDSQYLRKLHRYL